MLNSLRPAALSCSLDWALKSILVLQRPKFHAPRNSTAISLIKCEQPERTRASISWLAGLMYRAALLAVAGHPISKQVLPLLHMALLCSQHGRSQSTKSCKPALHPSASIYGHALHPDRLHSFTPSRQSPSMSLMVLQLAVLYTEMRNAVPASCMVVQMSLQENLAQMRRGCTQEGLRCGRRQGRHPGCGQEAVQHDGHASQAIHLRHTVSSQPLLVT